MSKVKPSSRPSALMLLWMYTSSAVAGVLLVTLPFKPKPSMEELTITRMLVSEHVYSRLFLEQPENERVLQLILEGCRLQVGFKLEQCQEAWQTVNNDDLETEAALWRI